jgi:hypothetical protein
VILKGASMLMLAILVMMTLTTSYLVMNLRLLP